MRVSVYKQSGNRFAVLVEAAVGNQKPPILLPAMPKERIPDELPAVLEQQKGKREEGAPRHAYAPGLNGP